MHLVRLPYPSVNIIYTRMCHGKISSILDSKSTYKSHAILPFLHTYGIAYKVRHFSVMYNQVTVNPKKFAHQ